MSARSVNSNLITMLKFNLTEIDVTFRCNISCAKLVIHITDILMYTYVFEKNCESLYLIEVSSRYLREFRALI